MKELDLDIDRLKIVHYPDPVLSKVAIPVTTFDDRLAALSTKMLELMRESVGVGLAANQVGVAVRLLVSNHTGEDEDNKVFVNPELVDPDDPQASQEGCLSLPGVTVTCRRARAITVKAFDLAGEPFEMRSDGLLARVWQHEMDHLNGRLIIDAMTDTDAIANRRALKQLDADFKTKRRK